MFSKLAVVIGKNLRRYRKQRNLTQEQLAAILGMQTEYVANVERGRRNITLKTLEIIAHKLGIPPLKLVHYELNTFNTKYVELNEILNEMDTEALEIFIDIANSTLKLQNLKKQ